MASTSQDWPRTSLSQSNLSLILLLQSGDIVVQLLCMLKKNFINWVMSDSLFTHCPEFAQIRVTSYYAAYSASNCITDHQVDGGFSHR